MQVQFTITNLGVESGNAACKVLALFPKNQSWKVNDKFVRKQWYYADTPSQRLVVGNNSIIAEGDSTRLHFADGEGLVDIVVPAVPIPLSTPSIDFPKNASGRLYEYHILIPWVKARIEVAAPGFPAKSRTGFAMLDRARSVGTSRDLCRGWVTFRGNNGRSFFLADFRLPPGSNSPAVGWFWSAGNAGPVAGAGVAIGTDSTVVNGKKTLGRIVTGPGGSFTIAAGEALYRYSFVDELGAVTGQLVKLVIGKPITTYYRAQARLPGGRAAIPGILELMEIE